MDIMNKTPDKEPFEQHEEKTGEANGGGVPPPAALSDGSLFFVEVDRDSASPSTEELSIAAIQTFQRMKAEMMHQMEIESPKK